MAASLGSLAKSHPRLLLQLSTVLRISCRTGACKFSETRNPSVPDLSKCSNFTSVACYNDGYRLNGCPSASSESHHGDTDKAGASYSIGLFGSAAWLFFKKKEEEETIELFVAKATVAEQKGRMDEAEDFYHRAIVLAHQQQEEDKATYIYDLMANFYLRIHKHLQAERLFKETIKRLLEAGYQQYDPTVIEISLKLASMYDIQFRYTEAEAGFRFCVSQAKEGLKAYKDRQTQALKDKKEGSAEQTVDTATKEEKEEEEEEHLRNLYATLGLSLDAFAKFTSDRGHLVEAEAAYVRAIGICENELAIDGRPHAQLPTLLNDLGTVYERRKDYNKAMEVVSRAEVLARTDPDNLPIILCNKATIHLRIGEREEATSLFRKALRLAEQTQNEETILFVRRAMSQLAAPRMEEVKQE